MKIWTNQHITCPYCKQTIRYQLDLEPDTSISQYKNMLCAIEEGGCDRRFVIEIRLQPTITQVFKLVKG